MITWGEHLDNIEVKKPIVVFSTATTGVSNTSEVICLSYAKIDEKGDILKGSIYNTVNREDFLMAQKYHRISEAYLNAVQLPTEDFISQVENVLKGTLVSYNSKFQIKMLQTLFKQSDIKIPTIYDLPLLLKGAEAHLKHYEEEIDSLYNITGTFKEQIGPAPSLKIICKNRDIVEIPPLDVFPSDYNVDCLIMLWRKLIDEPLLLA